MKTTLNLIQLSAIVITSAINLSAQITVAPGSLTYTQNFNSLGTSAIAWSNNSTISGWSVYRSIQGTPTTLNTDDGTSTGTGIFNSGVSGNADRSIGLAGGGTPGNGSVGLRLLNGTGQTITEVTVSYTAEVWRTSNVNNRALVFGYQVVDSGTLVNLESGTWTTNSGLTTNTANNISGASSANFPVFSTGVGYTSGSVVVQQWDGSAGANQDSVSLTFTVGGAGWADGQDLWLRWSNSSSASTKFAIDDVSFSAIPEPSAAAAFIGASGLLVACATRRRRS
jgi:hypothetical protein